jgi:hypothetical protein
MKNRLIKRLLIIVTVIVGVTVAAGAIALIVLQIRTKAILDDYSSVYENEKYQKPIMIEGINVIEQNVSCGYAVIEMFSSWNGSQITEQSLYDQYGKVVTSTGKAFCQEMNKQFPDYHTTMYKYLKNSELIDQIYENLSDGIPVPIEWAALCDDEWTLHYSLVIGADIPGDKITIANPYGYYEEIDVEELLNRTSFQSYENMPLFLRLGFAFGVFEKNTIFRVQ